MTDWLVHTFVKGYQNTEDPAIRSAYGRLAGWVGIVCNIFLALAKLLAGLLSGSIAIMADAANNLMDASSSIITLIGFKVAGKPADNEHPFGHARSEYVAGLLVAVLILVVGIELAKGSVEKLITPTPVDYSIVALLILTGSILIKIWMAAFNHKMGRQIGSATLQATSVDSRNDVIATGVLLLAALVSRFTGFALDGWMGLGVALFILYSGIGLLKETLDPLLGEAPDPKLVEYIDDKISGYEGVLGTHDLIVHDYGPGRQFASAHVEMSSTQDVLESHEVIDNIERDFLQQDKIHLIIHYDPIETGDQAVNSARSWVSTQVKKIDPILTIHDFRMVEGPNHTNYIFDVLVPQQFRLEDKELEQQIQQAVQQKGKTIYTVVTIDKSYAPIPN